MVAFHFQSSSQAAWRCDECRRQRLEARRRCGWLPVEKLGPRRLVWARGRVATDECPKSLVTPQSMEWIERFFTWKFEGGREISELSARDADAFLILEREWRAGNDAEHKSA